jgi:26S proteasome regulatory subunit N12
MALNIESELSKFLISNPKQKNHLENIKQELILLNTLPTTSEQIPNIIEINLALKIFEAEMEYYLEKDDEEGFEKSYLSSKHYYQYSTDINKKLYYKGLFLLYLISNNRITEYHFELEYLNLIELMNNDISFVIEVEHSISEGNFNKLLYLHQTNTNRNYIFYLKKLSSSLKFQIAKSAEKSYSSLTLKEVLSLLMINNEKELESFINLNKRKSNINWIIQDGKVFFIENNIEKKTVPSERILNKSVDLAIEIERII